MIEPDMATMLAFVLTDVAVPREVMQPMLRRAADASFNAASVDADQSTSDSLLCLSSRRVRGGESGGLSAAECDEFERALTTLCERLAEDVVRNGEGTTHVIRVRVSRAPRYEASGPLRRVFQWAVARSPPPSAPESTPASAALHPELA